MARGLALLHPKRPPGVCVFVRTPRGSMRRAGCSPPWAGWSRMEERLCPRTSWTTWPGRERRERPGTVPEVPELGL